MHRPALVGVLTALLIGCSSSESAPPAAISATNGDGGGSGDGGTTGQDDRDGSTAGKDGSANDPDGSVSTNPANADFAATLYTTIVIEGSKDLTAPASAITWTAVINVNDLKTTQPVTDAVVKAGPAGNLQTVTVGSSNYSLKDFATGEIPDFEVSIERGTASLKGLHLTPPAIHSFNWTNAADGADSVKHTVTWTPSGDASVKVNLIGAGSPVLNLDDTGSHTWSESGAPTSGTDPVQVVRIGSKALPPRSVAQVVIRVRSKI